MVILPAPAGVNHGGGLVGLGGQGLMACWYSGRTEAGRDAVILCARSPDSGATWSSPMPASRPHERDLGGARRAKSVGNVALARDAEGRLVMIAGEVQSRRLAGIEACRSWRCGRISFRVSTDDGASWSAPTRLDNRPGALPRSRPLATANLGDLVPVYREGGAAGVLRLDLAALSPGTRPAVAVLPIPGPEGLMQPSLVPSAHGVSAYLRDRNRRAIWVSRLDPDRTTWSPARPTNLPNPGSAIEAFVDGPRIALVYNPSRRDRRTLALAFSEDGDRFTAGCVLVPAGARGDVAYPAVAPLAGGWGLVFSIEGKRRIVFMRLDRAALNRCDGPPPGADVPGRNDKIFEPD